MLYQDFFKDKKITLMGLGLLGRGLGDARFLAKYSKELTVTDLKTEEELKTSIEKLKDFQNIKFVLGEHREEDFKNTDMIVKGNGVPLKNKFIEIAEKNKIPVYMSTALFISFLDNNKKVIGITGTKGKTTVSHMINFVLNELGEETLLAGNIPGLSTLEQIEKVSKNENIKYIILELDSWQLQGFAYQKISPPVAIFTNFFEDHLNYYPSMNEYFLDKANIFLYQKEEDKLFLGEKNISDWMGKLKSEPKSEIVFLDELKKINLKIPGEHNQKNANLVLEVLKTEGFSEKDILKSLEKFQAVSGRLELFWEIEGKRVWNDNNSTTPDSTALSFESLKNDLTWIGGGTDKNLNLDKLVKNLRYVDEIFLLTGTGTEKLKEFLMQKGIEFIEKDNFHELILLALKTKSKNILFSPAFSSFGKYFKNEYDRENQFKKIIKEYYEGR